MYKVLLFFGSVNAFWVIENIATSHYWWGTILSAVASIFAFWTAHKLKSAQL